MQIGSVNFLNSLEEIKGQRVDNSSAKLNESNYENKTFKQLLEGAVNDVNDAQITGYNSMRDIATGKVENLQEAVQRIEEAELSLKLGLEVKNKAISAYREVMRMQI